VTDDRQTCSDAGRRLRQTATGAAISRDARARHPIIIERLDNPDRSETSYRMKILVAGEYFAMNFSINHYHDYASGDMRLAMRNFVERSVGAIFRPAELRQRVTEQVMEIVERNGDFDNTAEVLETEERARLSIGVASPPIEQFWGRSMTDIAADMQVSLTREMIDAAARDLLAFETTAEERQRLARLGETQFRREYSHLFTDPIPPPLSPPPQPKSELPERRAWLLLYRTIGKRLARQFKKLGYFEVLGNRGIYQFHRNKQGGVTFIDTQCYGGREIHIKFDLCIQSQAASLPEGDVILSRYLSWQADEEAFLKTTNFRKSSITDEANTVRNSRLMSMLNLEIINPQQLINIITS